jgi:thiamine pyrophosphate-dependent acetolactate synthase large subunit-like protein
VAITGQAPTPVLGTDAFQEVDIVSVTGAVTKHNYLVTSAEELAQVIKEAFHIARSGQPGPVLVAIATDVLRRETEYLYPSEVHLPGYNPLPQERGGAQEAISGKQVVGGRESGDGLLQSIVQHICSATQGKVVIVAEPCHEIEDLGSCQPRTLVAPGSMGTKGFALPAAVGIQIGLPDEQVWVAGDDKDLQVSIQELATIVQENLPIRVAVLNRTGTGTGFRGRFEADRQGNRISSRLQGPDFMRLAEAYQIPGLRVTRRSAVGSTIAQAAAIRGPVLIDFQLEKDHP